MLRIRDTLAGDPIQFMYVEHRRDLKEVAAFVRNSSSLGLDTESTGVNPYARTWELRTVQIGDRWRAYVIPQQYRKFIAWLVRQEVNWIGHNGPHDARSIDAHLAYESGIRFRGETFICAHHADSRNRAEGGTGHGLKDLAEAHIDPNAGKWERELKKVFKTIEIPIPGEVYKSGPRKGQPKVRKAKLSEGWSLIDPRHPAYIAYAAADPILTFRVWEHYQASLRQFHSLYRFDLLVQQACDRLNRRAMQLDVRYTERLSAQFERKARDAEDTAAQFNCENVQSGQQVAATLTALGVQLTERTKTGQFVTDARVLRGVLASTDDPAVKEFLRAVLIAKQLSKRRESYTEQMLREMDADGCIHPSINILGARTARMSVSNPPLQQLPTKDREDEFGDSTNQVD